MVIFFLSPVESFGGGHGISREEEVCLSSPKQERNMTMAIFLPSSVERCGGGHGVYSREEEVCPCYSQDEEKADHGHLPHFLSGELRRWPWPLPSSSKEEGVRPSSPKMERVMTMLIFFPSSVESCGGGHGISSRQRRFAFPAFEKKRRMTKATLLSSSVDGEL